VKILQVITTIQKAAGTSVFCGELANGLVADGHDVAIAICDRSIDDTYPLDSGVKLIPISSLLSSRQAYDKNKYNIVHIHGLWSPILHRVHNWARCNEIQVVWSTHGMTAPWALKHKWWKKCLAWWLYQRRDLIDATLIHCTTEQEAKWNRNLGFTKCYVVPLGTDIDCIKRTSCATTNKRLLFVGRLYPVKGLENLIHAWRIVCDSSTYKSFSHAEDSWKLRIVGPDQAGHQATLMALVKSLKLDACVEFPGPKYGAELAREYDECDCLALPSYTENFGATVVDAMARGKPVITSTYTPWEEVVERVCGWWVRNDPQSLSGAILEMIDAGNARRAAMGLNGRKLVEEKYTWSAVIKAMVKGYEEIQNVKA